MNSPYRSAMCSGCNGVWRPERSAQTGIGELRDAEDEERDEAGADQPIASRTTHSELDGGDADREPERHRATDRILGGRAQPQGDERDPHDHVADDRRPEVELVERPRATPAVDDEDAGHLDEGQQPVDDVVGVVGGGEPGEVHPGPPDREEHDAGTRRSRARRLPPTGRGAATPRPGPPPRRSRGRTAARAASAARCASCGSRPAIATCHGRGHRRHGHDRRRLSGGNVGPR